VIKLQRLFKQILEEADRVGLNVIAYALFGMPGQTIDEMADTLIFLMGKRVLIGPSVYYPTPGTPLFEKCNNDHLLSAHPSQWRSSALPIETKDFNRLDLITLIRLARVINFIKGKMDEGELSEAITWEELFQLLKEKKKPEVFALCSMPYALSKRADAITWIDLLLMILEERSFFSLRRDSGGKLSVVKEKSSKRVLDYFFEKGWDKLILKSRSDSNPLIDNIDR
jgi:hypothetical protein